MTTPTTPAWIHEVQRSNQIVAIQAHLAYCASCEAMRDERRQAHPSNQPKPNTQTDRK